MAALTGNKIKDSYLGLLKSIDNSPFSPRASGTFVQISDGGGNALPLYLSTTSIRFYNAYTFPSADGTVNGQVLSTDANGTLSWITSSDNQTLEEVLTQGNTTTIAISSSADITTTAQFNGDINGALLQKVKAAEALLKGDVVYISGGTGDNPEVSKAKADSSTTMPALGIMKEPLALNAEGECITSGELTGVDLTGIATGDELFVSSATAGELVTTAPTGIANLIQKIGKVIKGGNGGALTVLGAFRTNAMPNLPTGILLGDTTNVATAITDGSLGQILSTDGNGTYSFIDDNAITSAVSPLNLGSNQISLGTVGVSKGGTGATTLTGILLGNGTSAISGITSGLGSDGHVLTADGNGGYAFEVASGDVSISGTPTTNQVAIWTDGSTIKGMSALEISTDGTITLSQPNSDDPIVVTNSYNIGGGNIANVTGYNNTGFGNRSLFNVTTGSNNVGLGSLSMQNLTTASSNTAIGNSSMSNDTITGSNNVAIGDQSLLNLQSGSSNVAIGVATMANNDMTGTANVAIGYQSLKDVTSGGSNVAIGYQSLKTNQNQNDNVAIGSSSMLNNTGNKNIAIGTNTLYASGFNISNVAIGHESLKDVTTGSRNTAIGYHSGTDNTTGLDNTFIGYQSGYQMTSGNNNVIIGSFSGSTINGSDNNIIISDGSGNNRIQVDSGGNVGIGTTPSGYLTNGYVLRLNGGGQTYIAFNNTTHTTQVAGGFVIGNDNSSAYIVQRENQPLRFDTNDTPRLTIASGGNASFSERIQVKGDASLVNGDGSSLELAFSNNVGYIGSYNRDTGGGYLPSTYFASQHTFDISGVPRLTISSGGLVGIGTASPKTKLQTEIGNTTNIGLFSSSGLGITSVGGSTGNIYQIAFGYSGGNYGSSALYGLTEDSAGYNKGALVFATRSLTTDTAPIERMRISSTGTATFTGDIATTSKIYANATPSNTLNPLSSGAIFFNGGWVTHRLAVDKSFNIDMYNSGSAVNALKITQGGGVGIGGSFSIVPSSQSSTVRIQPDIDSDAYLGLSSNRWIAVYAVNGSIQTSDIREKTEIKTIKLGLDFINDLNPISYKWKDCKRLQGYENIKDERNHQGLIAQEFAETLEKHGINKNEFGGLDIQKTEKYDDFHGMTYSQLIAPMIKAIQEQQTIIEDLKARIETLEG